MSSTTRHQDRQAFWKEHVKARKQSGLSKAHYCRDNNLTYHQFVYWASKYSDNSTTSAVKKELAPNASKFVPVMLAEPDYPTGLQLHLPNGVLISGISAHSVEVIGRLIEQL